MNKRSGKGGLETPVYEIKASVSSRVRFALVSDLHCAPNGPVIEAIKKGSPDAVLVCGDQVWLIDCGTDKGFGNHDLDSGVSASDVEKTGAVPLDDAFVRFGGILIGGLSPRKGGPDTAFLDRFSREKGFRLLLCHYPHYYDKFVKGYPVDLTLSGHAHGGQWRFFGRGVLAPGQRPEDQQPAGGRLSRSYFRMRDIA